MLLLVALSSGGRSSRAEYFLQAQKNSLPTHKVVPKPPRLKDTKNLLYVGITSYLGKGTSKQYSAPSITFVSAENLLILKDSTGIVHQASEIEIDWSAISIEKSKKIARQVAGPFSSFESAKQFSKQLEIKNISSVIAYPKNWEVWVPVDIQIPKGMNFRLLEKTIDFQIRPLLKLKNGSIPLSGPISLEAKGGLKWKGGIYGDQFLLTPDSYGTWTLIEKVGLEKYLNGVVPYEIGATAPTNALAVQAVLARTWALANSHRFQVDGYHLCSNTQCQVYKDPQKASDDIKKAIQTTTGKVLIWKGKPIHAVYHATNGGVMASANEAWSMKPLPYLRAGLDGSNEWNHQFSLPFKTQDSVKFFLSKKQTAYGNDHYLFRWKRIFTADQLQKKINSLNSLIGSPHSVQVLTRGPSGRVLALKITDKNDLSLMLTLDNIRRVLRRLPSTLFIVNKLQDGLWEFSGGGFGHGAGLSQSGAIDLARRGWSPEKILLHYYPGTDYVTLP